MKKIEITIYKFYFTNDLSKMKNFVLSLIFLICLVLVGCWDKENLVSGNDNIQDEFAMKQKCEDYKDNVLNFVNHAYNNESHWAFYSKNLNTCLWFYEWFWWNTELWWVNRIIVDLMSNQIYVNCSAGIENWIETERYEHPDFACYNYYTEYFE